MAKKNFNKGLEDIFEKNDQDISAETEVLEKKKHSEKKSGGQQEGRRKNLRKKSSRKNFTFDLNNLLSEALQSSDDKESLKPSDDSRRPKKKINKVPLTGINALIRKTIEGDYDSDIQREFKRVTFICDRDKVAKLKQIAKSEKTYLKDILIGLIEEYIKDFENTQASNN